MVRDGKEWNRMVWDGGGDGMKMEWGRRNVEKRRQYCNYFK